MGYEMNDEASEWVNEWVMSEAMNGDDDDDDDNNEHIYIFTGEYRKNNIYTERTLSRETVARTYKLTHIYT